MTSENYTTENMPEPDSTKMHETGADSGVSADAASSNIIHVPDWDEDEERAPRRRRRLIPLIVAAAVLAAFAFFFGFYYITDVEIVGNTQYADADVERLTLDGFLNHNSIILARIKKTIPMYEVPFLVAVDAEYLDHNSVRLHVSENLAIGRIEQDGAYYYFDVSGVILNVESVEESAAEEESIAQALTARPVSDDERNQTGSDTEFHPALTGYVPIITGLTDKQLYEGERIPVQGTGIFQTILSLTKLLDRFEMEPDRLDLDGNFMMTLYFGNTRVRIGTGDDLEEKISRAAAILPQLLEENLEGVLHLETYTPGQQNIIFTSDDEEPAADAAGEEVVVEE